MDVNRKACRLFQASAMGLAIAASLTQPALAADTTSQDKQPVKESQAKAPKTNIVYIVIDDMGYSDFGCYGSEIKTPNIDKLAANGLIYNNFNTCPLCSPTRASLLTGRDNHAVGMGMVANYDMGSASPDYRGRVKDSAATVAQILKSHDYSTMGVGKWHLAPVHQVTAAGPYDYWPLAKGFERFYGYLDGETDQYKPQLFYDNHLIETPKTPDYQFSHDLVDHAIQFVTDQVSITPDKPYFLYVAFSAVHSPLQAPKKYIDMYKGVYDQGWDKIREARFERQKKLGIIPIDAELTPRDPKVKSWDSLSSDEKRLFARFEETYAGYLSYADAQIGRLIKHLQDVGQYDNTMIVLISDNGGTSSGGENGSDDFVKTSNHIKPSVKELLSRIDEIGGPDFGAVYPNGWGMVSNTPFKGYKAGLYNGGVRDPLIIEWPTNIKAKGELRSQYVHVTDITPTVFDVLKIAAPENFQGINQLPIDGKSISDSFDNKEAVTKHDTQYYALGTSRSIYQNGWKAVASHKDGQPFENDTWELYNLNADFAENHNVAEEYPEKLKELKELWAAEAKKHQATLPSANEMRTAQPSDAVNNRNSFTYYQGVGPINSAASPRVKNRSYTITVPVTRSAKSQSGVLAAMGSDATGYTLYIKNNHLVYEYNLFGTSYKIESDREVPVGDATLKFEFTKTAPFAGIGRIYINDVLSGEVAMPETLRGALPLETLDIGRDRYSAVSKVYKNMNEFPFTGELKYVHFELKNDQKDSTKN